MAAIGANLRQLPVSCSGHQRPVLALDFSDVTECGYFLISGSMDGQAMLRHGDTGDWVGTFGTEPDGHRGVVWSVALNRHALLAATGSADFTAKIWNAVTGDMVQTLTHKSVVKSVTFNDSSSLLLTAGNEKLLRIYDLERPELSPDIFAGHTRAIRRAVFCRDNRCVLSSSDDRTLRLWDRLSGIEVNCHDFSHIIKSLELSQNGSDIISVAYDYFVRFIDAQNMEIIKEFKLPCKIFSVSLHPKKQYFVCGGADTMLYKYDYESGTPLEAFNAHSGSVNAIMFSPDGEVYASGSEDGMLRLWQTTLGKNYGLWKLEEASEFSSEIELAEISTTQQLPQLEETLT